MLPLLDVQLEWCFADYPSKVIPLKFGSFVRPGRSLCGITCLFSFLPIYVSTWNRWYIMANTLICWLHSCGMFSLLVEIWFGAEGWLYKLWDMSFLFWSAFCMAESWARRLSLYLACKPFPGFCACTRTSRWCASVVAIRSLSLFTNRTDRRSQISSLDSWCATRLSKTLDVVHRHALLVSNSDML